jgi:hypothetical protein
MAERHGPGSGIGLVTPASSFRYTQDVTAAQWLKAPAQPLCGGGRPGAEVNPKLGWMTEALEIDPFNSKSLHVWNRSDVVRKH